MFHTICFHDEWHWERQNDTHSERGTIKFVPCISNKNIFWPSLLIPEILLYVRMNFHICPMHKKSEQSEKFTICNIVYCPLEYKAKKKEATCVKENMHLIMMIASIGS
jgi:hypothetical protein